MDRRSVIGVMGGGRASRRVCDLSASLGRAIAESGWILLNGGRDAGVMAASARGAREAGGLVVGILPGADREGASPDLTVAVLTGMGDARNAINILSSDVVVALPGGAGTFSEIALARKAAKPLILLGWEAGQLPELSDVPRATTVKEVLEEIRRRLRP